MPGGAYVAGVRSETHAQAQGGIGRAQAAEYVADLLLGVQGGFVEADEGVAGAQVFPDIVVSFHVGEADSGSGGERPGPFRGTYEDAAQGAVETAGFVDDVGHLD